MGNWCVIDVPLNEQNVSSNDAIIWKKYFGVLYTWIEQGWTKQLEELST